MTCVTGRSVCRRISASKREASAGEPSASITTTPAGVMTNPAFDTKFWLAGDPSADKPSTYQAEADTWPPPGGPPCRAAQHIARQPRAQGWQNTAPPPGPREKSCGQI